MSANVCVHCPRDSYALLRYVGSLHAWTRTLPTCSVCAELLSSAHIHLSSLPACFLPLALPPLLHSRIDPGAYVLLLPACLPFWLADRLSAWLASLLGDCLSFWLTDWLTDRLTGWLSGWPVDCPSTWLDCWLAWWMTGCLAGLVTVWLTDWLTDWLTLCLAHWLAGWLGGWLVVSLAGWLTDWLAEWLAGWLAVSRCSGTYRVGDWWLVFPAGF